MAARRDAEWQVIPTAWVIAAQARWTPRGFGEAAVTAMAFDPAGGGKDAARIVLPPRRLVRADSSPPEGLRPPTARPRRERSSAIVAISAPVVVDVGGGYGGAVTLRLYGQRRRASGFNGAGKSTGKTIDGRLSFHNKRAEAWWRFREALDPDQKGGSVIALPRRCGIARRSHRADLRSHRARHSNREQGRHPRAARPLARQGRRGGDVSERGQPRGEAGDRRTTADHVGARLCAFESRPSVERFVSV